MYEKTTEPRVHVKNMKERLNSCILHLREDIRRIEEPQCMAMFETSAEVLEGLVKAFEDYEKQEEPAWQPKKKVS